MVERYFREPHADPFIYCSLFLPFCWAANGKKAPKIGADMWMSGSRSAELRTTYRLLKFVHPRVYHLF